MVTFEMPASPQYYCMVRNPEWIHVKVLASQPEDIKLNQKSLSNIHKQSYIKHSALFTVEFTSDSSSKTS